jgi:UDP:flavonoid glycosyltransferase YjiC (YdhE family)
LRAGEVVAAARAAGDGDGERASGDDRPAAVFAAHYRSRRIDQVARECDLAILNGTYTAITMLLAGKPVLQLPVFLEQAMSGLAIERLGAGLCAPPNDPDRVVTSLESLLASNRFAQAAQSFAARYADDDPSTQIERMVNRAEELATTKRE